MLGPTWPSAAQAIDEKGYQLELPDIWLTNGNPWEIARDDIKYKVSFYGTVDNFKWSPGEQVGDKRPSPAVGGLIWQWKLTCFAPFL